MPHKGYKLTENHKRKISLSLLGNTRTKGLKFPQKLLMCKACKNIFSREEIINNIGFCNNCITHTKSCDCVCGEIIFAYTKNGNIRRCVNQSHTSKLISLVINKRMKDPEYLKQYCDNKSKIALRMYADKPEYKDRRRKENLERFSKPEERKKLSDAQIKRYSDPKERELQRNRLKKAYENSELKERVRLHALGNKSRTGQIQPKEERLKRSQITIKRYEDKKERIKVGIKSKEYWDNHPEEKERRSIMYSKEGNPAWNGGTSFEPYDEEFNDEFKEMIRSRQNYRCADSGLGNCRHNKKSLHIHHINRIKVDTTPENCIALCNHHHGKAHNENARMRHRKYNESFSKY